MKRPTPIRSVLSAVPDTTLNGNGTSNVNSTGATYITNNSGGLIKGATDSGIGILGYNTSTGAAYGNYTATSYAVVITNNAGATIEGNGTAAVIDGSANATISNGSGWNHDRRNREHQQRNGDQLWND